MAFHHVAIATRELDATHRFYSDVMGFTLAKVEAAPTPEGGWARHLFYDTGGGECLAIWDVHDDPKVPSDFDPSISRGLGLPSWTNHLAFAAHDLAELDAVQQRWRDHGYDVLRIDHGWCTSIYLDDPNGIAVECCTTTRPFTEADAREAEERRTVPMPPLGEPPIPQVLEASKPNRGSR
jgi:catechol 2,3-dioxygenase-like lactoylglutathione lyase family enzyme